jgi:amino acid adenylation domain-containing protein
MQGIEILGFALSPQQEHTLSLIHAAGDSSFGSCVKLLIQGTLDRQQLERALAQVVARHEILRTQFVLHPALKTHLQVILPEAPVVIEYVNGERADAELNDAPAKPFDLNSGTVLRCSLRQVSPEKHILTLSASPLCADARSLQVVAADLAAAYATCTNPEESEADVLQYADIAEYFNSLRESDFGSLGRHYWHPRISSAKSPDVQSSLPHKSGVEGFHPAAASACIPADTGIQHFSQEAFLLTCWYGLLQQVSNESNFVIGYAGHGRETPELENSVGPFERYLPLKLESSPLPVVESVKLLEETVHEALQWQGTFQQTEEKFHPVCFSYYDGSWSFDAGTIRISCSSIDTSSDQFELKLSCTKLKSTIAVNLWYDPAVYPQAEAEQLLMQFVALTANAELAPGTPLAAISAISPQEQQRLLLAAGAASTQEINEADVVAQIEERAKIHGDRVAVEYAGRQLSYAELNHQANQLARYLLTRGARPEVCVGIYVERSLEMVIGLLAILKTGGAYVPLDPSCPAERLAYMLEDARAQILLTQKRLEQKLASCGVPAICLDSGWDLISNYEGGDFTNTASDQNLAYVIYTSGSTGRPKGVALTRKGFRNYVNWAVCAYNCNQESRSPLYSSLGFDLTVTSLWPLLVSGGCVSVVPERDGVEALAGNEHDGTFELVKITPAHLRILEQALPSEGANISRRFVIGGEALRWEELSYWRVHAPATILVNEYGPTETVVGSCIYEVDGNWKDEGRVPIGRAIGNTRLYAVDKRGELAPTGAPGELYIGGEGVARGYLNQPALTAEKFVPDSFSGHPGERLYRTGDLVRWMVNGQLDYLGRMDEQMKIRGYRIELGEIEGVLLMHPAVQETTVLVREDVPGDKRLVAYVVFAAGEQKPDREQLKEHLRKKLPEYMMPSAFVDLKELPLTNNGKVNRKALPRPEAEQAAKTIEQPRTVTEEIVAGVWKEVLRLPQVGIDENFFELGGHSLLATQVVSRLRALFEAELPLRSLFEAPTIRKLAQQIEQARHSAAPVITRVDRNAVPHLPLSYAQQRLWFINQLEPESFAYNIPFSARLKGRLNKQALWSSLNEIVRRHEVLRTSFPIHGEQPLQCIADHLGIGVRETDLTHLLPQERDHEARLLAQAEAEQPFDLAHGPLLRAQLLQLEGEDHVLLVTMHHIVSDGWSVGILVKEFAALYAAYDQGQNSPLADLQIQYADYALWQREWLQGTALETQLQYWKAELENAAVLELPTDRPRTALASPRGGKLQFELGTELTESVKRFSQKQEVTLFMTLLGAFQILLARYSGQEDVVVGTDVANRNRLEVEPLVGFFVNQLVLRARLHLQITLSDLLKQVRRSALGAYAHQDLPFEKLVEELAPERDLGRSPFFQVKLVLQNTGQSEFKIADLEFEPFGGRTAVAKLDLEIFLTENAGRITGEMRYAAALFDEDRMQRLIDHYQRLLEVMVSGASERLSDLSLLSQSERQQILVEWNQTHQPYPQGTFVHKLFERQVEKTPAAVAVEYAGRQLTYADLDHKANQLAHYLIRMGVEVETPVGIYLERSPEMIIALLGILKAGGVYVPLDPSYPTERLGFMVGDAQTPVLLTQNSLRDSLPAMWVQVTCVDRDWNEIEQESGTSPSVTVHDDNLAYVIYTSGSSGQPKGVGVTHGGLANYLTWAIAEYRAAQGTGSVVHSSLGFDLTVTSIYPALLSGGCVKLVPQSAGVEELAACLYASDYTLLKLTPSHLQVLRKLLEQQGAGVDGARALVIGGEALKYADVEFWRKQAPSVRLVNEYGPTETVVGCVVYEVGSEPAGVEVPIGKPIANTAVYVLDEEHNPLPPGVPGELYIAGAGVARGYLNRPGLTAEKFVPDPFNNQGGARMYRTGDQVQWRSDGILEYLGRRDEQVKIRGYRIELEEIETVLNTCGQVEQAVVIAREDDPGDKRLVGYVVRKAQSGELSVMELRQYLKQRLPDYMVPVEFVVMEELPLTTNGKVDRRALPKPQAQRREGIYQGPRNMEEEILCGIFEDVLKREPVNIRDNFFDLGGHSLLATQVISRIRNLLKVDLPLRGLFESPSVAGLAGQVQQVRSGNSAGNEAVLQRVSREQDLPLSYAQERLWFIEQLEPGSATYNIAFALRLEGVLKRGGLRHSLEEMLRRHEILRTSFPMEQGVPVQRIAPSLELKLYEEEVDLSAAEGWAEAERRQEAQRLARAEAERPFDLAHGPLLRVKLLRLGEQEHVLVVTMHHIISDGWSTGVMVREFSRLYEAYTRGEGSSLEELQIQYGDYTVWQREWLQGEGMEEHLGYWKQQLAGVEALDLPTEGKRRGQGNTAGGSVSWEFSEELSRELNRLGRRHGATLFMTLLGGWQLLLSRYSGQQDVAVGTVIANRNRVEMEGLIGLFVNTLVLRTDVGGNPSFVELLERVRETTLGAYAHQDVPFEKVVEELQPERDLSRTPLFQVMFVLQNVPGRELELPELKLSGVQVTTETAKFELTLTIEEQQGKIRGSLGYRKDLFSEAGMQRMVSQWESLLTEIVSDPQRGVNELPMLSMAERQQMLVEWNRTEAGGGAEKSLVELFEEQVERSPEAVAVSFGEERLSYGDLNARANQLGRYLRKLGVGREALVGIHVERSLAMMVGILGILKAGGAYVPLDPNYPAERIKYMLDDAGVEVLLSQSEVGSQSLEYHTKVVELDSDWETISQEKTTNLNYRITPETAAYVIYTSGSTGRPKGAVVTHANVVRLFSSTDRWFNFGGSDVWTLFHSCAFDFSVWEFWGALLYGGRLIVVPYVVSRSPEAFYELVKNERVTVLNQTPSAFRQFSQVEESSEVNPKDLSLRYVIFGGEALEMASLRPWFTRHGDAQPQLINMYGITETTVHVTYQPLTQKDAEGDASVIGRRIPDLQLYILDAEMHPNPIGVAGELYVGGAGLARGYFNRPELTAQRFVPHPFSRSAGERLYRTGDLARHLDDGNIEYLGRLDHQVKIRGFRIELGEIEAVLARHPDLKHAVVVAGEDGSGEKRLVGYVVPRPGVESLVPQHLKEHLRVQLPDYMVPAVIMVLEKMPLTPSGKLDRKALPDPGTGHIENGMSTELDLLPRDEIELELAMIWEDLLQVSNIGRLDSFFELGGHSLLAVRLLKRVKEQFGQDLSLAVLFENPTIAHLADLLRKDYQTASRSNVAPLRRIGSRKPLFLVHPLGGHTLQYLPLVRLLGPDQPVYSFQTVDEEEISYEPFLTIEERAARYVKALREIQPDGIYAVAGWSYGGYVAYEMAQQLRGQGQQVNLILFDIVGMIPTERPYIPDDAEYLMYYIRENRFRFADNSPQMEKALGEISLENMQEQSLDVRMQFLIDQLIKLNILEPGISISQIQVHIQGVRKRERALLNYALKPYRGTITLIRTEQILPQNDIHIPPDDPTLGWGALAMETVQVHFVPGNHFNMVFAPHVQYTAEAVKLCLIAHTADDGQGARSVAVLETYS